ncbi:MAG: hypothetical protein MZV63_64405 [Marinilabiliales bacterium]|nr:hypothetical protein [Marinilabiliales bacterium]
MAAIMTAVEPFLVTADRTARDASTSSPASRCYGGTFQQFNAAHSRRSAASSAAGSSDPTDIDELGREDRREHPLPLHASCRRNPQQSFCDVKAVADLAHSLGHAAHRRRDRAPRRP